jgi:hypothetical protein
MDIEYGAIVVQGFVSEGHPGDAVTTIIGKLEEIVFNPDAYTTGNYGMTKVKITIELQ